MSDDNHPMIEKAIRHSNYDHASFEDRAQVYEQASLELVHYSPQQRQKLLDAVETEMLDGEGSWRQKAQLLNLHRSMSDVSRKLKAVGR